MSNVVRVCVGQRGYPNVFFETAVKQFQQRPSALLILASGIYCRTSVLVVPYCTSHVFEL